MNKEYIYIDGNAIIKDEKDNHTVVEYYDNLDDVLVQENLIETMENRIKQLEKENEEYKKHNKKRYIPILFPSISILSILLPPIISYLLGNTDVFINSIDTINGTINQALSYSLTSSLFFIPISALFELNIYSNYKKDSKKAKGINSELNFLNKQLDKEKEILVKLKNKSSKDKENKEFRVVEVKDIDKLKILRNYLNLYFNLGYNEQKYSKYYQDGKLDETLRKNHYDDTSIELAKEYLAKESTLVKRKTKKSR